MKEVLVQAGPWVVSSILFVFLFLMFAACVGTLRVLNSYKRTVVSLTEKLASATHESSSAIKFAFDRVNELNEEVRSLNRGNRRLSRKEWGRNVVHVLKEECEELFTLMEEEPGAITLQLYGKGEFQVEGTKNTGQVLCVHIGGRVIPLSDVKMVPVKKKPEPNPVLVGFGAPHKVVRTGKTVDNGAPIKIGVGL